MSNLFWRFSERLLAQVINFIVSIVLARILVPEEYGLIALVTIFTQIFQVFVDSGMANALIQKKDADELDFSSVFYFNIIWCVLLYIIMFLVAPKIAYFYRNDLLIEIIRVLGLTIVVSGVKNVQQAYVSKTLQFKKFFWSTLGGSLFSAVLGIWMAIKGYGVWALVAQHLSNLFIDTLVLWITAKWRPKLMFSFSRLKELLKYGWKLLVSALIDTGYNNLRQLIIGKIYTSTDLAFFNQGKQFPNVIVTNINTSIDSVLFPVMSSKQDDIAKVRDMTRRSIKISLYILAPLMIGLSAVSDKVVSVVLTDKWLFCVPYLQIFCISYMFWPIHTANLNAIKAIGRSDLFLKLEVIKKILGLVLLFSTIKYGVLVMALTELFTTVVCIIINSWPNKKLLNYGIKEQFMDIIPTLLLAILMGVIIYMIGIIPFAKIIVLIIQILLGAFIYIIVSIICKNDSFYYLLNSLRKK